MKSRNSMTIILVLAIAVTTLAFGSQSQVTRNWFGFEPQANANIPDHILYDRLFRMIISFKRKAESQTISGEKAIGLTNYFKNRANLNDEENRILQSVALEYIQELAPIDAQARTIITQTRQTFPNSVVPREQPPPAELVNLQEQRNALALRYRDQLQYALGADGFAKFDEFVQRDFASRFQAIPLSEVNFNQAQ